jgi:hypothetical protein
LLLFGWFCRQSVLFCVVSQSIPPVGVCFLLDRACQTASTAPPPHLIYLTAATPQHLPHCHIEWRAPKRATTTELVQPNTQPHRCCNLIHTTPPSPPIAHHCCFQRRAPNRALVGRFQVFGPNPSLSLTFPTGRPHHHHHHCTIPPLLIIIPCCHFTWRTRNRATTAQFRVFGPNPLSEPHVSNQTATPPPTTLSHHPSSSSPAAVSHGMPKTELRQLSFGFLAQTPSPSLTFPSGWPHHHHHHHNTIPPPPSHHPPLPFHMACPAWFRVFDPNPTQKYSNI